VDDQKSKEELFALRDKWYAEAATMRDVQQAADFAKRLLEYEGDHDYSSIVYALGAGAVALCSGMDREGGGITGFQAGAVMWEFIANWGLGYKGKPLRLQNFADMLFPQYDYKFEKTITRDTWDWLQNEAQKNLEGKEGHPGVRAHWQAIADGHLPFGYAVRD
jgi:hypothetical protein